MFVKRTLYKIIVAIDVHHIHAVTIVIFFSVIEVFRLNKNTITGKSIGQ